MLNERDEFYPPGPSNDVRRRKLLRQWSSIRRALVEHIDGITLPPARAEKRYEDALDALVCAWIGTRYLEGRVRAYGDDFAAVWT